MNPQQPSRRQVLAAACGASVFALLAAPADAAPQPQPIARAAAPTADTYAADITGVL